MTEFYLDNFMYLSIKKVFEETQYKLKYTTSIKIFTQNVIHIILFCILHKLYKVGFKEII